MIPESKVDLILASDTIYTPATIRAFISVVNQIATPETMIVIASHRYYFGLGGGTQALNALIEELHLPLRVEVLKTLGTDSVKRDIIRLYKCASSVSHKQLPLFLQTLAFLYYTLLTPITNTLLYSTTNKHSPLLYY